MACLICDAAKTVRSHIIPKAFALEVRDGASHGVAASKHHKGAKPMQGGFFSDKLLCAEHEGWTAPADKYAVEFVRSINEAWKDRTSTGILTIANPKPELLRSFCLFTIWREIHSRELPGLSLGPYDEPVRKHLFGNGPALEWPVISQRTNFSAPKQNAIDYNLHPYQVRFADRSGWLFVVAGVAFFIISDQRGLPAKFAEWRADIHDPALVTVSDSVPATEVTAIKGILANMAK